MFKKNKMWFLAGAILLTGIIISNILSNQRKPMTRRQFQGQSKPVKILTIRNQDIPFSVNLSGRLYAYDKVEIFAEVSGVLQKGEKPFKEGIEYRKTETLIHINDSVYKNNVLAQKSRLLNQITLLLPDLSIDFPQSAARWETYLKSFQLNHPLAPLPEPATDQERYYIAARNIYDQFYSIKGMEATLVKYKIRAPFNGVVTSAGINPGTLVRQGQKLGEFTRTDLYEMMANVSLFAANRLKQGQSVTLATRDLGGRFEGRIQRINRVIDQNTMQVKIFIHLKDTRLRDGMYMTGVVTGEPIPDAFTFDRDLLIDKDHIFVAEGSVLTKKQIEVVEHRGNIVIARGLSDGTKILGQKWAEAREGSKIPSPPPEKQKQPGRKNQ